MSESADVPETGEFEGGEYPIDVIVVWRSRGGWHASSVLTRHGTAEPARVAPWVEPFDADRPDELVKEWEYLADRIREGRGGNGYTFELGGFSVAREPDVARVVTAMAAETVASTHGPFGEAAGTILLDPDTGKVSDAMPCVLVIAGDGQPWLVATGDEVSVSVCGLSGRVLDSVPAPSDLFWQRTGAPSWHLDESQVHLVEWPGGRYRFAIAPGLRLSRVDGPRNGDLVRARVDNRDGGVVEGCLHLRHVPSLDYVQVIVRGTHGEPSVDPLSIEIAEPQPPGTTTRDDDDDPFRAEPTWREIVDLDEAAVEGLIPPRRARVGGSWEEMFLQLDGIVRPFVEARWEVIDSHREESSEFGDSVAYDLRRGADALELELYEDGGLSVWALDLDDGDSGDDGGEPLISLAPESDVEWARACHERGWTDPE